MSQARNVLRMRRLGRQAWRSTLVAWLQDSSACSLVRYGWPTQFTLVLLLQQRVMSCFVCAQTAAECAAFLAICPGIQPLPKALLEAALLVRHSPALPLSHHMWRQVVPRHSLHDFLLLFMPSALFACFLVLFMRVQQALSICKRGHAARPLPACICKPVQGKRRGLQTERKAASIAHYKSFDCACALRRSTGR